MSDDFDPYHKWLSIRDPKRPPNHYRLLGLELFETDPDVIAEAAQRQMAHVRTFQLGPHSALSQKLLNELAAAKICLSDQHKKAEYDRLIQERVQPLARQDAQVTHTGINSKAAPALPVEVDIASWLQEISPIDASPELIHPPRKPASWFHGLRLVAGLGLLLALGLAAVLVALSGHLDTSPSGANAERRTRRPSTAEPSSQPTSDGEPVPASKERDGSEALPDAGRPGVTPVTTVQPVNPPASVPQSAEISGRLVGPGLLLHDPWKINRNAEKTWTVVVPVNFRKAELFFYSAEDEASLNAAHGGYLLINGKEVVRYRSWRRSSSAAWQVFFNYLEQKEYRHYTRPPERMRESNGCLNITSVLNAGDNKVTYFHQNDSARGVRIRTVLGDN